MGTLCREEQDAVFNGVGDPHRMATEFAASTVRRTDGLEADFRHTQGVLQNPVANDRSLGTHGDRAVEERRALSVYSLLQQRVQFAELQCAREESRQRALAFESR